MRFGSDPIPGQKITKPLTGDPRPLSYAPVDVPAPVAVLDGDVQGGASTNVVVNIGGITAPAPASPGDDQKFVQYSDAGKAYVLAVPAVTLGGDATGPSGSNTVGKVQGVAVPAPIAGNNGQFLQYNSTGPTYVWATPNPTLGGDVTGAASANTVGKLQGKSVPVPALANDQQYLRWNNTTGAFEYGTPAAGSVTLAGDASGPSGSNTVGKIQNKTVPAPALANDGQYLRWNNTSGAYEYGVPVTGSGYSIIDGWLNNNLSTTPTTLTQMGRQVGILGVVMPRAGTIIGCFITTVGGVGGNVYHIEVYKNGVDANLGANCGNNASSGYTGNGSVAFAAGDILSLYHYQNVGGTLATTQGECGILVQFS